MSRMIKPHPGELVDRQTILELKIAHVESTKDFDDETVGNVAAEKGSLTRTIVSNPSGINVHPFVDELELVTTHLKNNWIPTIVLNDAKTETYDKYYAELKEVNSQLWDLEDKARTLRDAPDQYAEAACKRAAEVLFSITSLNDKRADLVKKINGLWGFNSTEKLY